MGRQGEADDSALRHRASCKADFPELGEVLGRHARLPGNEPVPENEPRGCLTLGLKHAAAGRLTVEVEIPMSEDFSPHREARPKRPVEGATVLRTETPREDFCPQLPQLQVSIIGLLHPGWGRLALFRGLDRLRLLALYKEHGSRQHPAFHQPAKTSPPHRHSPASRLGPDKTTRRNGPHPVIKPVFC